MSDILYKKEKYLNPPLISVVFENPSIPVVLGKSPLTPL